MQSTAGQQTMNTLYTTPAGARRIRARLADALARYDEVVAGNPEAAESGDTSVWHDNFAYEEAQRQMHALGRLVRDLRRQLGQMIVVDAPRQPTRVGVGTWVELVWMETGVVERWAIAGHEDGDPKCGRVSYTAPLARALLEAEVGEERRVPVRGRPALVRIESIGCVEEDA